MFGLVYVHVAFFGRRFDADVSMEGFQAATLVRFISSAVIVLGSFIGENYMNGFPFELFA